MRKMKLALHSMSESGTTEHQSVESIDIKADDGRTLYSIAMNDNGDVEISTGSVVKVDGVLKDASIQLLPKATNSFVLRRPDYK